MTEDGLKAFWERHRGKLTGALAGFFLGALMALVGVFWGIVIFGLTAAGFVLGRRFDEDREGLEAWLDRILQDRR